VTAKFSGKERLLARMKRLPPAVRAALIAQNAANAAELTETQKGFVRVDDGDLRESIQHRDATDATRITQVVTAGGATAPHGWWVEAGTSEAAAYPFFWPAWRMKRRKFRRRMSMAAKKAVDGVMK
jgi:hypothetical protein